MEAAAAAAGEAHRTATGALCQRGEEEEDVTNPGGQELFDPTRGHRGKVDFAGVQCGSVECHEPMHVDFGRGRVDWRNLFWAITSPAQDVARIDYDFKRIHRRVRPRPISSGWHCVARKSMPGPPTT